MSDRPAELSEDDWFQPDADPASADREGEPTNVCRVTAMVPLFTGGARDLTEQSGAMGFGDAAGGADRVTPEDFAHAVDLAAEPWHRGELWHRFIVERHPAFGLAFLLRAMGSRDERESAASAAAVDRLVRSIEPEPQHDTDTLLPPMPFSVVDGDDPVAGPEWLGGRWAGRCKQSLDQLDKVTEPWERVGRLGRTAQRRLDAAFRSTDAVTLGFALATVIDPPPVPREPVSRPGRAPGGEVSTVLHGTWGWRDGWWRPRGDFHNFVSTKLRHLGLHAGGARAQWSGALRASDRQRGASELIDWAGDMAPGGLHTLFAHSYGGEVAALAIAMGLAVDKLVFLSVPIDPFIEGIAKSVEVVDVRLVFDPVLALIPGTVQHIREVTPLTPSKWNVNHSATHHSTTWDKYGFATTAKL